jgi:hypothetical protein
MSVQEEMHFIDRSYPVTRTFFEVVKKLRITNLSPPACFLIINWLETHR